MITDTELALEGLRLERERLNLIFAMAGHAPADPRQQWESAIAQRMATGLSRFAAIQDIGRTDPALWEAYNRAPLG